MRFTVAIPAYKEKFLQRCIQSVINQDFGDFELIIVNDKSPDDLDTIIKKFDDPRIVYYTNEKNCGAENVVDNWNICLSYTKGDYIVLLGDDDELMPNYLSVFNDLINQYPLLNVYHCRSYIINDNSDITGLTPSWPQWESVYENIWHRMSGLRSQYISDFVYKTKYLNKNGGFFKLPLAWASDDITSFEASYNLGIAHTQEPVFCYRESGITLSSSGSVELKLKAIKEENLWYEKFLKVSQPSHKIDVSFYNRIKKDLNRYITAKRIDTIAYNGIRENHMIHDFLYFAKRKKNYELNIQHLIYALILAVKKKRSGG